MALPRNFTDEALVLRRSNYSEADRLLTIFTKNHGKLFALAKGSRKAISRKAPHIELFTHTKLSFASSPHYLIITQAETIDSFLLLKTDLAPIRAAFHLNEIIDQLLPEQEPYPEIFAYLTGLFNDLNQPHIPTAQRQQLITDFQLTLLDKLGFGHPITITHASVYAHIEDILDHRLHAAKSLL